MWSSQASHFCFAHPHQPPSNVMSRRMMHSGVRYETRTAKSGQMDPAIGLSHLDGLQLSQKLDAGLNTCLILHALVFYYQYVGSWVFVTTPSIAVKPPNLETAACCKPNLLMACMVHLRSMYSNTISYRFRMWRCLFRKIYPQYHVTDMCDGRHRQVCQLTWRIQCVC